MKTTDPDPRMEAARYLAEAVTGVKPEHLFADGSVAMDWFIEDVYEDAVRGHRTCGCERHLRLTAARDVLLGVPPAARGELRLL